MLKYIIIICLLGKAFCFESQPEVALTLCIISIALMIPHSFIFKSHLRVFDFMQIVYLFSFLLPSSTKSMSNKFGVVWIGFVPNLFYKYCDFNDFVCKTGSTISFMTILIGCLLFFYLLILLAQYRGSKARFLPIYNLFKGLIRWVYISLSYYSLQSLILGTNLRTSSTAAAILVLIIVMVFPLFQVIILRSLETESTLFPRQKWVELVYYYRLLLLTFVIQVKLFTTKDTAYLTYLIIIPTALVYVVLHKFDNHWQRGLACLTEACLLFIYTVFTYLQSIQTQFEIDYFFVIVIVSLEILYQLIKIITFTPNFHPKYDYEEQSEIDPYQQNEGYQMKEKIDLKQNEAGDIELGSNIDLDSLKKELEKEQVPKDKEHFQDN